MKTIKPVNNEFYKLRIKKKLTQIGMAKKLGVAQSTVSKMEKSVHAPDFEFLVSLRRVFKFNINKFIDKGVINE